MMSYMADVWRARYFWWHLSMSDLRGRFRRSSLGILWAVLQPLALTLLLSFVFSKLLNQSLSSYAPYILSGIIIWEYISFTVIGGSTALIQADAYIKQTRNPLAIYTLRNTVSGLVVLSVASISLFGWVLVMFPQNFSFSWLAIPTLPPVLALIVWPLATIVGYIGARFRDLPNALALLLQAAWFISPVYFKESMFREGGLNAFVDYNPIYHVMQILRAPVLYGEWPTAANYIWCLGLSLLLICVAVAVGVRAEKRVIFYL